MAETVHYCLHNDDCKSIATCDTIDGRYTSCEAHRLRDDTYKKSVEFARKAKERRGSELFGYWGVVYVAIFDKVNIFCKRCNDYFAQPPHSHISKYNGCGKCRFQRASETIMERYGVRYTFECDEIKKKAKASFIKRYGHDNPFRDKEVIAQIKKTNLEKYGVEHTMQTEVVRKKVMETNIKRYGCVAPLQNLEIQERSKKTNLERYGVEYSVQNIEIMEKTQRNATKYKIQEI